MTTFSQLVDKMTLETKRLDLRGEIATYLNQTLRELHMEPTKGNVIHYRDNLKEDIQIATTEEGFYWDVPNPAVFQGIVGCRYDSVLDQNGNSVWATEMMSPNRGMADRPYWFYRSGQRVFFKGYGGVMGIISLAWYEYPRSLKWHDALSRAASYDDEAGWTYAAEYDVDDTTRQIAQALVSNWLLLRWPTVIEEGLRAKVYKRLSDTERARTSYSMYQTLRQGLYTGEIADVSGSW